MTKYLPNNLRADIEPLTFGRARLVVSKADDFFSYLDGW